MKSNVKISVQYIKRISLILFLSIVSLPMLKAQFNVFESFMGNDYGGEIVIPQDGINMAKLTSGVEDPIGQGWLRLTSDNVRERGYAYLQEAFPTNLGVYLEFEYKAWRTKDDDAHWGADGFSVFFFDAEYGDNQPFRIGGHGGSLGYAQLYSGDVRQPGLAGGYLGIGIDEYGNFGRNNEGKQGGATNLQPNSIVLRGPWDPNNPRNGYDHMATYVLGAAAESNAGGDNTSVDYDADSYTGNWWNQTPVFPSSRPDDSKYYRKVKIYIIPIGEEDEHKYEIRVLWRTSPYGADVELINEVTTAPIPDNLRVGFAASTGGGFNNHEVRNLYATTTGGVRVNKTVNSPYAAPMYDENVGDEIVYNITVANEEVDAITGDNFIVLKDVLKDDEGNTLTNNDFELTSITFDNKGKTQSTASGFDVNGQPEFDLSQFTEYDFETHLRMAGLSEVTFTIKGKAKESMMGKRVHNTVDLDVTHIGFTDSDLLNNTSTATVTILNPNLDLGVVKSVDNGGLAKESGNRFTIVVTNNSTSDKLPGTNQNPQDVFVTDIVPQGLSIEEVSGAGWTISHTNNNYTFKRSDALDGLASYPPIYIDVIADKRLDPYTNTATLKYKPVNEEITKTSSAKLRWRNLWVGTQDNDWGNNANWTVLTPNPGANVEFATANNNNGIAAINDLHVDGTRVIGDLTNATTKNLVIPTGKQLTINGKVYDTEVAGGTIIVHAAADAATGSLIFGDPSNNTTVDATVQFYNKAHTADCGGQNRQQWQYFGIPVSESDGGVFPLSATINKWNEGHSGNKWVAVSSSDNLTAFTGYEINDAGNTTPTDIYNFSGKLNVGNKTITLTKSANVNYSGWNLIANSYTGAIPITSEAIHYNNGQNFGVYLFNTGSRHEWRKMSGNTVSGIESGRYTVVPSQLGGQGQLPDRIPSMHAFMIKAESAGTLTLDYSKLMQNTIDANQPAWRLASQPAKLPYIVMDVIGTESADRVWLFENRTTTRGFDAGWDGEKMAESGLLQLYVAGDEDLKLQVATVPQLEGTFVGLKPTNNENITVSFSVSTDVEPRGLYLRDMLTGRSYPIRSNNEYTLPGVAGEHPQRFKVVNVAQGDEKMMTDDGPIEIFVIDSRFAVTNKTSEICVATVFDIMGRVVVKGTIENNATQLISTSGRLPDGVYLIRVNGNSVNVSKRVMLK